MPESSTRGERYERWLADYARRSIRPPVPAATAVLLRDAPGGVETLLLRRNPDIPVMGGVWVFPGGRMDAADRVAGRDDSYAVARVTAVRETAEEAGLQVDPRSLVRLSHWTPPADYHHQLATWFFVAQAPPGRVQVDGREIAEHLWLSPAEAIRRHTDAGGTWFLPPTYVTLHELCSFESVDEALAAAKRREPTFYETRLVASADGETVALWAGDAGFESGDADVAGARHRLWAPEGRPWRLERSRDDGLT